MNETITAPGCAILAGGAGKRMGGVNKAELKYGNKSFLERISGEMEKTGMPCFLSQAAYEQSAPKGWKEVKDCVKGKDGEYVGPIGGVYSCLKEAAVQGLAGLFFAPCDSPFFTAEIIEKLSKHIDGGTDAVIWRTPDGLLQTTYGWYSVRCIKTMEEDIYAGKYKLSACLQKLRLKVIETKTEEDGIDESLFSNINTPGDYRGIDRKHILICGKKQSGKTTIINRIIRDSTIPVYGYQTRLIRDPDDGMGHVCIYPAGKVDGCIRKYNEIGITDRRVISVENDVMNKLGCEMIDSARDDGMIIMDEIGFMEENAELFCRSVMDAFDGDVPVLAAIKDTDLRSRHIREVLAHPRVCVLALNERNRDEIYEAVSEKVSAWMNKAGVLQGDRNECYQA